MKSSLDNLPYELVTLKISNYKEKITVEIDNKNQEPVTVKDCASVVNILRSVLNVETPDASLKYEIEVSSAGLDRVLQKPSDFIRFVGHRVSVNYLKEENATHTIGYIFNANEDNCIIIKETDVEKALREVNKKLTVKNRYTIEKILEIMLLLSKDECADIATPIKKNTQTINNVEKIHIEYVRISKARLAPLL